MPRLARILLHERRASRAEDLLTELELTTLRSNLAASGLNVTGLAAPFTGERFLEGARAVLVVGSAGPGLWDAFVEELATDPALLSDPHPLEAFVRRVIQRLDPNPGPHRRWVFSDLAEVRLPDAQRLALEAGLGWRSRLQLILHPRHGPWMALRAMCWTVASLPTSSPLEGPSPCEGCPAPCRTACPAGALEGGELSWRRCLAYRAMVRRCDAGCAARMACPVGEQSAYSPLQLRYHADPRAGRLELGALLGISSVTRRRTRHRLSAGAQWLRSRWEKD